ncbi:chymotrypsin inhibitor-like [Nomia melanderi]|uniref:chymotrypsin inhibitor-like n=1 Tax=Nomia melanderi TaxID=2448451 RepID=UPI00130467B5|nr:chymotrypsin inhibitor-like [Nomia melanderi]
MSRYVILLLLIAVSYIALNNAQGCGPNERFTSCKSACQATCKNPNVYCIEECMGDGCECKPGYVRNSNNQCVLQSQC